MPVQTIIWAKQAQRMFYACQDRYGDMFTLRIALQGSWVVLGAPEAIKQVFTGDPKVFHAGEGNQRILEPLLGPNSLFVLDEKPHMSQRKLLLPPFQGSRMKTYNQAMSELAAREIESWPTGVPYKLRPRMLALTLDIILRTVFGSEGERLEELREALRDFLELVTQPRQIFPLLLVGPERMPRLPWFRRSMDRVNRLIYREIAERRRAEDVAERDDVLSMMILARHEDDSPMSDEEIRDELLTLLMAGHETTATSLAWTVERLIRHPAKLERLRAETEAGSDEYLTATIQETLRLRPVISLVPRRLTEPVEIGGYVLPAGSTVTPCAYLVHRNPEIYPEPERFLPERFLENPPGTYTWIPFGGGIRRCLGAPFAMYEMESVLRELVKRRQMRPANPKPERILRRTITENPGRDAEVILSS